MKKQTLYAMSLLSVMLLAGCAKPSGSDGGASQGDGTKEFENYPYCSTDENDFSYKAVDGGLEITAYKGNKRNVIVPDMIKNNPVVSIGRSVFKGKYDITSIKVSDNIKKIDDDAFYQVNDLTSVTLPKNLNYIGEECFHGTKLLRTLEVPKGIEYIGPQAFENCYNLTVYFNDDHPHEKWDEEWCVNGHKYVFNYAGKKVFNDSITYNLVKRNGQLTVSADPSYDNIPLAKILDKVKIDNVEYTVTELADYGFKEIPIINIPKTIKYIGQDNFNQYSKTAFLDYQGNSSEFKNVYVAKNNAFIDHFLRFNKAPATFKKLSNSKFDYYQYNNEEIMISKYKGNMPVIDLFLEFNGLKITAILNEAFVDKSDVTDVSNGNDIEYIGNRAFANTSLSVFDFNNKLRFIGNIAFAGTNFSEIKIPSSVKYIGRSAFANTTATKLTLSSGLKEIPERCFENTPLDTISFGSSITSIGSEAFSGCHFKSITLPNSVKEIGAKCFAFNRELKEFKYGTGIEELTYRHLLDNPIETLYIPTNVKVIGDSALVGLSLLKKLYISKGLQEVERNPLSAGDTVALKSIEYDGTEQEFKKIKGYTNLSNNFTINYN